jgi:hypothetical protein
MCFLLLIYVRIFSINWHNKKKITTCRLIQCWMWKFNEIQIQSHGDFECKVIKTRIFFLPKNDLGGTDFGTPLQIQYVNPNSLAEQCGMRTNDYILRIGQISTEYLQHKDAQEQIKRQNNVLEFILQRFVWRRKKRK